MSEDDIDNELLMSQEQMNKRNLEWLNEIQYWTKTADIQFVGVLQYWLEKNKSNVYPRKLIRLVTERTR